AARDLSAVSYRLVRRVACDADARALRDPHDGESAGEPAKRCAHRHDAGRGDRRPDIACDTTRAAARLYRPAAVIFRVSGGGDADLPGPGRLVKRALVRYRVAATA